jgi:hypothetical protein
MKWLPARRDTSDVPEVRGDDLPALRPESIPLNLEPAIEFTVIGRPYSGWHVKLRGETSRDIDVYEHVLRASQYAVDIRRVNC